MTLISVRRDVGEFRQRYRWMALAVLLAMSAILARLFWLQVIEHERWAKEARDNVTRHVRLPAVRGLIRDERGRILANNRPSYDVFLTPSMLDRDGVDSFEQLMRFSRAQKRAFVAQLDAVPERRRSQLLRMFSDVTREQLAALETHEREIPGLEVVTVPMRAYPLGSLAAHAVGFVNEVNADDIKRHPERGYEAGDAIGRSGVEAAWESYLRGIDGVLTSVAEVPGQESVRSRRPHETRREPLPGRDLRLTLDVDLMRSLERAFRGHPSGAAVVVDVRNGRVRAMFSKPSYDLNEMSGKLTRRRAAELEGSPFRPLIDKTVYETYFPGSTFKAISALAALEDGVLGPGSGFECPGYYELGNRRFRCSHVHGQVDMRGAIVQSCNVYFYRLAELVGLDRLASLSRDFGLGAVTGIGINTEASGFVPTRQWYTARHDNQYRIGFTLNAAIGQGNTRVTLIQLAMVYATIANGGTLYVPQLVRAIEAPDGSVVADFPARVRRRVSVDPKHLASVIDGMYGVVNDPRGTAYEARIEGGVPVAGKTGTAQVSRGKLPPGMQSANAWYFRRSHAWFAGFAPADDPELAIVVLLEHGGQGGKEAAPIAVRVLQEALGGGARKPAQKEPASPARGEHLRGGQEAPTPSHAANRSKDRSSTRARRQSRRAAT